MRFPAVVSCLALGLVPALGLAADPPGEVGALQAVYDFCAKMDPSEAGQFEKRADSLVAGLSAAQLAALRAGSEFQRGYHVLAGVLPELKGNDAVAGCQAISGVAGHPHDAGEQPHDRDEHRDDLNDAGETKAR